MPKKEQVAQKETAKKVVKVETVDASTISDYDTAANPNPVRKRAVDIAPNELINVRSVTSGGLSYLSTRTNMLYTWAEYGDVQPMEYQELVSMKSSNRGFLFKPLLVIDDEQVAEKLGLTELYNQLEEVADLDGFFGRDLSSMRDIISKLPSGAKETIKQTASEMVRDGKLYDTRKIKMLEKELNTDLMILLDE